MGACESVPGWSPHPICASLCPLCATVELLCDRALLRTASGERMAKMPVAGLLEGMARPQQPRFVAMPRHELEADRPAAAAATAAPRAAQGELF